MAHRKGTEVDLRLAKTIVDSTRMNDLLYAFAGQISDLLKALPHQTAGKEFDGLLEILSKLAAIQVSVAQQFETHIQSISQTTKLHQELPPQEPKH